MYTPGNPAPQPVRSGPGILNPSPPVAPPSTMRLMPPSSVPRTPLVPLTLPGHLPGPGQQLGSPT